MNYFSFPSFQKNSFVKNKFKNYNEVEKKSVT